MKNQGRGKRASTPRESATSGFSVQSQRFVHYTIVFPVSSAGGDASPRKKKDDSDFVRYIVILVLSVGCILLMGIGLLAFLIILFGDN